MGKSRVLIIDDDKDIIEFLSYNLEQAGFKVESESKASLAVSKAITFNPDLVLLDIMMPDLDGMEVCEEIRKTESLKNTIITFLTARSEDYSQIAAYEAGADDYITKPIKPKVLVSKIKALLKRKDRHINNEEGTKVETLEVKAKNITVDRERYIVTKAGQEFILPKKEFELIYLLSSQPDKVFMRDEIYSSVWGDDSFVGDRTIDVHIRKLRKRFGENMIRTIKGVGYKFSDEA